MPPRKGLSSYRNPIKDARLKSTNPAYRNLLQGFIVQHRDTVEAGATPMQLHFLYNPSILTESHTTTLDVFSPEELAQTDAVQLATIGSFAFDLLFDRTYEVQSNLRTTAGLYKKGVLADVAILKKMVGYTNASPIMRKLKFDFFFGAAAMHWVGVISSVSIDYTNWTDKMVPVRCKVSIGCQFISTTWTPPVDAVGGIPWRDRGTAQTRAKNAL